MFIQVSEWFFCFYNNELAAEFCKSLIYCKFLGFLEGQSFEEQLCETSIHKCSEKFIKFL